MKRIPLLWAAIAAMLLWGCSSQTADPTATVSVIETTAVLTEPTDPSPSAPPISEQTECTQSTELTQPTQPADTVETAPPVTETTPPTTEITPPVTEPLPDQVLRCEGNGYQITVPGEYTIDRSLEPVVTQLSRDDIIIEIYRQSLSKVSAWSYLNYSNKFLENTVDHTLDRDEYREYAGRQFRVIGWHRDACKRLDGDKNHYLTFEYTRSSSHYSIFIKSSQPIADPDEYRWLLESLEFFQPEETALTWTGSGTQRNWDPETAEFFQTCFGDDAPLTWGIFEPTGATGNFETVHSYEDRLDYDFPIFLTYLGFTKASYSRVEDFLNSAWDEGMVVELTLQTVATADGSNMMYDILQGEYDSVIYHYADVVADFSHPVLMRLANEMNGDWCQYSAYHTSKDTQIYKAVYRYIWNIFERMGADNAIWI